MGKASALGAYDCALCGTANVEVGREAGGAEDRDGLGKRRRVS